MFALVWACDENYEKLWVQLRAHVTQIKEKLSLKLGGPVFIEVFRVQFIVNEIFMNFVSVMINIKSLQEGSVYFMHCYCGVLTSRINNSYSYFFALIALMNLKALHSFFIFTCTLLKY